jgi:hypothetical protein
MEDFIRQHWEQLLGRIQGPFWFRLILQPLVSAVIGFRAAARDVRLDRPPFVWSCLVNRAERRQLLLEGWKEVSRVFIMAVIIDLIYQIMVLHWIYPLQAMLVASVLSLAPYPVIRGVANRIIRLSHAARAKRRMVPASKRMP